MESYLFIQTNVGQGRQVADDLCRIEAVRAAEVVTGAYDVVARVEAADTTEFRDALLPQIEPLPGITRVVSCHVQEIPSSDHPPLSAKADSQEDKGGSRCNHRPTR